MASQLPDSVIRVRKVLEAEASAVQALAGAVDQQARAIEAVCELIIERCSDTGRGRLMVVGMGKAGLIGRKLAATFASTGTPAGFLHPAEARHGDLGMVAEHDVLLVLSNSGSSEEIVALLPSLARIGAPVIALTGRCNSPLGRHAEAVLDIGLVEEACPLGLAPSTSTTAMLAYGDAIALAVQEARAFTPEQYGRFHPGGALGRKLMTCREAMRADERIATVAPSDAVSSVIRAITTARAGSALLVDTSGQLLGIFTDGDLRRLLSERADPAALLAGPVAAVATMPCRAIGADELLSKAIHLCAEFHIDELPVTDGDRLVGLIDLQDLADRGFEL
ncbi:MAG: KpsF/GutQ family sugar-phosphate isomerase [Planctomycetota bacterium]|jgi:arabinose-5-phosphate isomerase|nr:KpsF/GutQ family sugar-phosphate isomerase [Planctomycetota bacterium]